MSEYFELLPRLLLGTILVLASLTKWLNYQWFVNVLQKYRLTPYRFRKAIAFAITALN